MIFFFSSKRQIILLQLLLPSVFISILSGPNLSVQLVFSWDGPIDRLFSFSCSLRLRCTCPDILCRLGLGGGLLCVKGVSQMAGWSHTRLPMAIRNTRGAEYDPQPPSRQMQEEQAMSDSCQEMWWSRHLLRVSGGHCHQATR